MGVASESGQDRLEAIARWVRDGHPVADIGAGDGQLTQILVRRGSPSVIATEAKEGPYRRLLDRMASAPGVEVRFGSGLAPIRSGEVETVVVAGMGAHTIARILEADKPKAKSVRRLVLGPMGAATPLRSYLRGNAYPWAYEDLAFEGGKYYEILITDRDLPRLDWDPMKDPLGPLLTRRTDELARGFRRVVRRRVEERLEMRRRAGGPVTDLMRLLERLEEASDRERP